MMKILTFSILIPVTKFFDPSKQRVQFLQTQNKKTNKNFTKGVKTFFLAISLNFPFSMRSKDTKTNISDIVYTS